MLIAKAYAQAVEIDPGLSSAAVSQTPGAGEAFMWNMIMIIILFLVLHVGFSTLL